MRKDEKLIVFGIVLGVVILVGIGMILALRAPRTAPKTYPADKGPNFIDVTAYPAKMQKAYNLFTNKCSRCHTVARPINSTFTPEEWRQYVYKMMRKPGSGLTPKPAEEIIEFLIYDAQHREKKKMIIAIVLGRKLQTMIGFLTAVMLCAVGGIQIGFTKGESMKKEDFQVSVDGRRIEFTPSPIFKEGTWFVPLKPFAEQLELKVEYPPETEMVVLCGGVESELCVPLEFQNGDDGAVKVDGVTYVQPAHISETFGFEVYKASANQLEVIHPTHLAPEFTLPDLEDTPRRLRNFRGKKTFLYVWGSW